MTTIARLYIAACALPPSPERTCILEAATQLERSGMLSKRTQREQFRRTRYVVINGEVFETRERRYRDDAEWTQ